MRAIFRGRLKFVTYQGAPVSSSSRTQSLLMGRVIRNLCIRATIMESTERTAALQRQLYRPTDLDSLCDFENDAISPSSDTEPGVQEIDVSRWKPCKEEYGVMITIATISLMVALDATILVPVLPQLTVDLDGTATQAFWAGTSYLLTSAVFQPFIAALSDLFGRREMLLLSLAFFTLGTLLCAPIAWNFEILLAGRALQGVGGGGIVTLGQVIFADIIPLRQRPKYFGIVLAAWALGSILGPLVGGLFVEQATWKWCFYVNFPFCALGFVMVPLFIKLKAEKLSFASKLARADWLGGFLFIGGMTAFLIGLSWAGVQFEWSSAQALAPMFIGLAAVSGAVVWEVYVANEPFLRTGICSSASAVAAYGLAFGQGFLLFCALYYMPLYFSAVRSHNPIQSGLDLLPVTVFLLPGSIIVSRLTTRFGRFRWAVWLGWTVTALGTGLFLLFDTDTPSAVWAAVFGVFGIGNGMVLTGVNVAIQAISQAENSGRAAAMYAFARALGMSIGVAIGGTTFQNVMSKKLAEFGLPEAIAKNAEAFIHELRVLQPDDPVRVGAIKSYVQGLHGVFYVMMGVALACLVACFIIKGHSMDKPLDSTFAFQGSRHPSRTTNKAVQVRPAPSAFSVGPHQLSTSWSDAGKLRRGQQQPVSSVVSYMVGPGGWRVPINPLSGGTMPVPRFISQTSVALLQMPEAIHINEDERQRILWH
ncbi:major facilitator superfamily domain-containing protein [Coniochaeta sp. 2T2.1]|nr:major facilitator superfamily domain-containing protein [Coniochaeta sp. 2T2.1]